MTFVYVCITFVNMSNKHTKSKKQASKKSRLLLESPFIDAFTAIAAGRRDDARLDDVIEELGVAVCSNEVTAFMEALLHQVDWNQCDRDTLRAIVVALFTRASDDGDDDRCEALALFASNEHAARCACCAEHARLKAMGTEQAVAS